MHRFYDRSVKLSVSLPMGRSTGRIWQFANVQAVLISFNFCSSSYIFVKLNALLLWSLCETQRLTPHGSFDRSHLAICECSSSFNLVQFL
ncbi:hypothetical protein A6J42_21095 [Leptospira interrogans serovar Copenhageni]|nr:hypothetical protein A6J42_21095 [Leptospira interrogans serovar Copenhageni]